MNLKDIAIGALLLVIVVLLLYIIFTPKYAAPQSVVITLDSTMFQKASSAPVSSQPILISSKQTPATIIERETIYKLDTTATKAFIQAQYAKLLDAFLAQNRISDTLHIGSMGYIALNDTVQKNMLTGRSFMYDLKFKTITKTVTVTNPPDLRNKLYFYGGVEGNRIDPLKGLGVRTGLLFQNKKDRMVSLGISFWPGHNNQLDLNYYQKISWR